MSKKKASSVNSPKSTERVIKVTDASSAKVLTGNDFHSNLVTVAKDFYDWCCHEETLFDAITEDSEVIAMAELRRKTADQILSLAKGLTPGLPVKRPTNWEPISLLRSAMISEPGSVDLWVLPSILADDTNYDDAIHNNGRIIPHAAFVGPLLNFNPAHGGNWNDVIHGNRLLGFTVTHFRLTDKRGPNG